MRIFDSLSRGEITGFFAYAPDFTGGVYVAGSLKRPGTPLRADRFGLQAPVDPLQRYGTAQELLDGRLDGRSLISQWRAALPMGVASMASYLLILWVWTAAPIALAAALRDTSAVFATLIAVRM